MEAPHVNAVIFDWAGTTVDFGCRAPATALQDVFRRNGIDLAIEHTRGPTDIDIHGHIRNILQLPPIATQWNARYGRMPSEEDIGRVAVEFAPLLAEAITRHADIIPGTIETIAALRARGIAIGSTTGYSADIMALLAPLAAKAGYVPDCVVCASDVPDGRPGPDMAIEVARRLGVYDLACCVKVGDTVADIKEGTRAKMWSIGVVDHGNEVGFSRAELDTLPPLEVAARRKAAQHRLVDAGAHYVASTIGEIPICIDTINKRLANGGRP